MSGKKRSELFRQAIYDYSGRQPDSVDVHEDPEVEGTYAIRANGGDGTFQCYLVIRHENQGVDWIVENLEEVEFDEWPPPSGKLYFL